ncbi:hypothetical protein [Nocardioides marmotae]|uniref:Uncharacterized protein n=1 Tax=Nocardioides marmotae TaxID=2663857 RepID=A0A6I3JGH8_9ACTN|nr:hypothetical protein [Nocardioides marmotae]MCR6033788.1 hypothetical protein [Gordonia jinghuaiqii]MBC9735473.1 hypothetical protein [Nocardioides marmotae]MTB86570.1 hypothetical protein [Nocardioides marmotae]MTB97446.1 hypothetical protein [Nocardioides marmotae]QKE01673.1 hypothetical protein HPC71_11745 [Nocardioides marmotae]
MSEQADLPTADTRTEDLRAAAPVRTGVEGVDRIVATVEELEDRPLEEHVAVFEAAHEGLRRALDADPGAPAAPGRPGAPA